MAPPPPPPPTASRWEKAAARAEGLSAAESGVSDVREMADAIGILIGHSVAKEVSEQIEKHLKTMGLPEEDCHGIAKQIKQIKDRSALW